MHYFWNVEMRSRNSEYELYGINIMAHATSRQMPHCEWRTICSYLPSVRCGNNLAGGLAAPRSMQLKGRAVAGKVVMREAQGRACLDKHDVALVVLHGGATGLVRLQAALDLAQLQRNNSSGMQVF
jgi:hypothetical protein